MSKKIIAVITLLILMCLNAGAVSMEKRHSLGLNLGMWNQVTDNRTEIGFNGVETSVGSNGVMGGISYSHWLSESLILNFAIEGRSIDINNRTGLGGVTNEQSGVASMLMGVKINPFKSTYESTSRPYFIIAVGPFIGDQSKTYVGFDVVSESRTEIAFGGLIGGGMNFITGRHFMLGFLAGYNLMTDFDNPIGGSKNYSGPEFSFNFNWLFGHGIE